MGPGSARGAQRGGAVCVVTRSRGPDSANPPETGWTSRTPGDRSAGAGGGAAGHPARRARGPGQEAAVADGGRPTSSPGCSQSGAIRRWRTAWPRSHELASSLGFLGVQGLLESGVQPFDSAHGLRPPQSKEPRLASGLSGLPRRPQAQLWTAVAGHRFGLGLTRMRGRGTTPPYRDPLRRTDSRGRLWTRAATGLWDGPAAGRAPFALPRAEC
jgi:hypothetical protein